jgi:hypothetical protein
LLFAALTALSLGVLYVTGVLSYLVGPLLGDDGRARYEEAARALAKNGYTRVTPPKTERAFTDTKLYLDLEPGRDFALVLGSGPPVERVSVEDPRGHEVARVDRRRFHETLVVSPDIKGVYVATVRLHRPGRYRWALHRGPERVEQDSSEVARDRRSEPSRPRQPRRRHRARDLERVEKRQPTQERAAKRPIIPDWPSVPPTEPPPGPPEPPSAPPSVEEETDIERAFKAGRLDAPDEAAPVPPADFP